MNIQKPRLHTVMIAVSAAIIGLTSACNSDSDSDSDHTNSITKDYSFYKKEAQSMLANMSTSEKLDVVSGPGMNFGNVKASDTVNLYSAVAGVAGHINGVKNDKLDIPAVKLADGPAGLRISSTRDGESGTYYATAWPIGSLLASTWDTDLVEAVGKATGEEVKEYGVDILLAPGMNIQRNPLNGRNFEYYSEDPLLTGKIGASMVNGVESNGVGATIKHFFGNESETDRYYINNVGDPRTFREIYMRGFQIAVDESQPMAIMTSYNKLNGAYVNHRRDILSDILRDEWGFHGLVMSDWFAGNLTVPFQPVIPVATDAYSQLKARNNLIEPGGQKDNLQASIDNGELTIPELDENVVDILTQVQQTPSFSHYVYSNNPDLNAHAVLARKAGTEGMVLLKNDIALPIAKTSKIASFGVNQINTYKGGTGSGDVHAAYTVSIADGIANKFTLNTDLVDFYTNYFDTTKVAKSIFGGSINVCPEAAVTGNQTMLDLLNTAAADDDVAVISIGRISGEAADRTSGQADTITASAAGDYQLSTNELDMITTVSKAFHDKGKKVVVVLNVAGVVDTTSWANKVDGILLAYMGGQDTGNEIADILSGDVNPSGKLAQTFPATYSDVPSSTTFPGEDVNGDGVLDDIKYNEGIYVGYRYYNTFGKSVAYPFGYGLSYTTFGIEGAAVSSNTLDKGATGSLTLTATVSNTGSVAGKEVAQVYINAPEVKLKKPEIELKAFDKTDELATGASQKLTFNIPAKLLASFDPDNNQWIVEPGTYKAYISNSSDVSGIEPVTFAVSKEIIVSNTTPGAMALPAGVSTSDFVTVSE